MDKKTYSAAETRILARISQDTLERYLREYADYYFSPGAQTHKRGRRFDDTDIKNIMLIRRMHFARSSHADIVAALTGENGDVGQDWLEVDEIARTATDALTGQRKNEQQIIRIKQDIYYLRRDTSKDFKTSYQKMFSRVNDMNEALNILISRYNKEFGEKPQPVTETNNVGDRNSKPGLLERIRSLF